MKQKITKGKVVQHCLSITAAIVVAGGVGFQFHEIQGLEKDLNTLNDKHTAIVQELNTATDYAKGLESKNILLVEKTDKLSKEVSKLQKDNKSLDKAKKDLAKKNKELQAKEQELSKDLIEERERPRRVTTTQSTSSKPKVVTASTSSSSKSSASNTPSKPSTSSKPVAPSSSSTKQVVYGTATAYTANCEGCTGTTASGDRVAPGMIAMASWVPLGTKVRITCDAYPSINGIYTVSDRGGAIKGNKVDVFMESHSDAVDFGRRSIKIEILD